MFINLFVVLLLLAADSPIPKFHFQLKKKLEKGPGKGRTKNNLPEGVRTLAQLYALYSHIACFFNQ